MQAFSQWYNHQHRHSALRYVTPAQRHSGEAEKVLSQRRQVYEAAKARHPERWASDTRKLSLPNAVHLNPERESVSKTASF